MFEKQEKLELSQQELAVIETALHTQSKILNIQAGAGAKNARERLNEVKSVLARVSDAQPVTTTTRRCAPAPRWFGMSRIFG